MTILIQINFDILDTFVFNKKVKAPNGMQIEDIVRMYPDPAGNFCTSSWKYSTTNKPRLIGGIYASTPRSRDEVNRQP